MDLNYSIEAETFLKEKKYTLMGRNWGNSWHSLCSYRGKLKPALAAELIEKFTSKGETVLDPMGGVGTIALEANIQGRIGISNDLSSFASTVAAAKLNPVSLNCALDELDRLKTFIEENKKFYLENDEVKNFGLNGKIAEYYHPDTLIEILAARDYFINKPDSLEKDLVMSCVLHILHGNRPYALSRTSHSLTPYAPKGNYIYKNLVDHAKDKILRMYGSKDFFKWNNGESFNFDILELPKKMNQKVDVIITSPPFASSFKFYTQNWLRLWFSGWNPRDFKLAKDLYFDEKQNSDMDIYLDYFEACSKMLKSNGKMILHLGKSKKFDMANELSLRCQKWFKVEFVGVEDVSKIESHGIKDSGATIEHQFLFLKKR